MAKGRMLNKKISLDDKVNRLSCDTARLLFTWLIAHLDGAGCFYGDAIRVKNLVFPLREDIKVKKVEQFLQEMNALGLISFYFANGNPDIRYLFFPKFKQNQPGLRQGREAASDIPVRSELPTLLRQTSDITPSNFQQSSVKTPLEEEVEVEGEVEENAGVNPAEEPPLVPPKGGKSNRGKHEITEAETTEVLALFQGRSLDIPVEIAGWRAWCQEKGQVATRRRLIAWLQRAGPKEPVYAPQGVEVAY